jgi:RNA polymerase sigma-70 factor (ECF subfamily)
MLAALDDSTLRTTPDPEVIAHVLAGDRAAFEILYKKYIRRIYSLVFRMVHSDREAEEVTQEVFCQVYRALPRFQNKSQFYTWLYRIATNVALQHAHKCARQRREGEIESNVIPLLARTGLALSGNPERIAESRSFYTALDKCIRDLPPNQRIVMVLGPIQGHSYAQMATITGESEVVIKGRLHRARETIRVAMNAHR